MSKPVLNSATVKHIRRADRAGLAVNDLVRIFDTSRSTVRRVVDGTYCVSAHAGPTPVITEATALRILRSAGTYDEIANCFAVSPRTVQRVMSGTHASIR